MKLQDAQVMARLEFRPKVKLIETFAGRDCVESAVLPRHRILMKQDEAHASVEEAAMARFWKERYASSRHSNKMHGEIDGVYQPDSDITPRDNLLVHWVYFVNVCQFDFQFLSLRQLEICLEYFRKKIPGSSRVNIGSADHWEVLRWYERLPKGLRREPNRLKIVKALEGALAAFSAQPAPDRHPKRPSSKRPLLAHYRTSN